MSARMQKMRRFKFRVLGVGLQRFRLELSPPAFTASPCHEYLLRG